MFSIWGLIAGCGIVIVACILFNKSQDRKNAKKYEWQPDLSHNVIENKSWGANLSGGHFLMTKLPKSQEQHEEEKRAYLNERKENDRH
jgi:hypothetical protein